MSVESRLCYFQNLQGFGKNIPSHKSLVAFWSWEQPKTFYNLQLEAISRHVFFFHFKGTWACVHPIVAVFRVNESKAVIFYTFHGTRYMIKKMCSYCSLLIIPTVYWLVCVEQWIISQRWHTCSSPNRMRTNWAPECPWEPSFASWSQVKS